MMFVKLSILLLFLRLFGPSRATRLWIYVGMATTIAVYLGGTIVYASICVKTYPHCGGKLDDTALVVSAVNVISDFYVLLLPLFVVANLQMRRARKILVGGIFCTGLG